MHFLRAHVRNNLYKIMYMVPHFPDIQLPWNFCSYVCLMHTGSYNLHPRSFSAFCFFFFFSRVAFKKYLYLQCSLFLYLLVLSAINVGLSFWAGVLFIKFTEKGPMFVASTG